MRTKSNLCRLLFFVFIFNVSALYGQVAEKYVWSSFVQGSSYTWSDVTNWKVNGYTPGAAPGPEDSVFIDYGSFQGLFTITDSAIISIAYFQVSDSIGPFSLQVDTFKCTGDVQILGNITLEPILGNSKSTLIMDVDSGKISMLNLSGVFWHPNGDLVKMGQGQLNLSSDLLLDTSDYDGGDFYFEEGIFNTNGHNLVVKKIIIDDHENRYHHMKLTDTVIISEVQRELDFTRLDSFSASGNNCYIIVRSKEEDVLDLNLGDLAYPSLQVDEMGVNLTHSGAYLGHLYLEAGESHSFHSTNSTYLEIYIEFNLIGDDTSKYTLLRNAEIGDGFKIKLHNVNGTQQSLNKLILRDMHLYNPGGSSFGLDVYESLGSGDNIGWNFINSPDPQLMVWSPDASITNNKWNDSANWDISGGLAAGRAPLPCDTVLFDNSGFSNSHDTVLIDELVYCHTMYWNGPFTNSDPVLDFKGDAPLLINGSMYLSPDLDIRTDNSYASMIFISDSSGNEIKTHGKTLPINMHFTAYGNYTLLDKLRISADRSIIFENGGFNSDGFNISAGYIQDSGPSHGHLVPARINIKNSFVNLKGNAGIFSLGGTGNGSSPPLSPLMIGNDSTIIQNEGSHFVFHSPMLVFLGNGQDYNKVTSLADSNLFVSSNIFNELNVKAGSYNGIVDSITIKENLFINDTSTQRTIFNQTVFDIDGGGGLAVMPTSNSRIINNSSMSLCLENVIIEFVDVINHHTDSSYISGSLSDTISSDGWAKAYTKCYMDMFGTVQVDSSNAFSDGHVVIFKLNPNSTAMFDTLAASALDSLGRFMFNNLSPAKYMLKANPRPATGFMPAYCPSEPHWSDADTIELTSDISGMVITVRQPPAQLITPGAIITGKLNITPKSPSPYLNLVSDYRGPSEVFDSIVIGIINKFTGDLLMLDTTDNNGFFVFTNIPQGQYRLMPDIAGIAVDTANLNVVNVGLPTDSFNFDFGVDSNLIYVADTSSGTLVSTSFLEQHEIKLKLWPNPVRNHINILSEEHIRDIKLYDQLMREIRPDGYAVGRNQYVLDLSGLKRGIYHLRINGKNVKDRILKL